MGFQSFEGNNIRAIIKYFSIAAFILIAVSCTKETNEIPKSLNEKLQFSKADYERTFKDQFFSTQELIIKNDSIIYYYDTLKYFYSQRDFQALLVTSFDDNKNVFDLISVLEKTEEQGLNPEQYHFKNIINEFNQATDTVPNVSRYYHLALTELFVSDALLKYSRHLRYGVVNPREIFSDTYFLPYEDSSKGDLFQPLKQENLTSYFDSIQPKSKRYLELQEALKHYSKFIGQSWPQINLTVNKIEYGSESSEIPLIVDRLITLGYLDTSTVKISNPIYYDSLKFKCVQKFQRDNGLNDDGVIGKNTVLRLNFTPEQYVNTIKINLERFRWNDYPDTGQYVLVNIPDFRLFIVDSGAKIFESKVCTGSKRPANFLKSECLQKIKKMA